MIDSIERPLQDGRAEGDALRCSNNRRERDARKKKETNGIDVILEMSVVKKSCCSTESKHQGGVDAALLKTVWFRSPTNDNDKIAKRRVPRRKAPRGLCGCDFGMSRNSSVNGILKHHRMDPSHSRAEQDCVVVVLS